MRLKLIIVFHLYRLVLLQVKVSVDDNLNSHEVYATYNPLFILLRPRLFNFAVMWQRPLLGEVEQNVDETQKIKNLRIVFVMLLKKRLIVTNCYLLIISAR